MQVETNKLSQDGKTKTSGQAVAISNSCVLLPGYSCPDVLVFGKEEILR